MKFLGLDMSKAFVRSPECNATVERFHRTLNEQIFQKTNFDSLEQAKEAIKSFIEDYNQHWMLHRLGWCSPLEAREKHLLQTQKKAA